MKQNPIRQVVFPILAALIWGTAFVAQDVCADSIGAFTFNAARYFIAVLALLVLIVVVLVAGYCKLILIPINDQISSYRLNMEAEQTELDANQGKMAQMQKMQKAIEEIKAAGEKRTIPQYDNSGKLMIELHEIMSDTLDYSLDCSAGTVQQDYIMLRPIVMTFRTSTYAQARQIVDRLCSSENISQISDMNMNTYTEGRNSGTVETTLVITYFEIMP